MKIDDELEPPTVYSYAEDFPSFSVFEAHSPWGAHVEREDVEEEANVFCYPKLLDMPRDVTIGTLVHEFVHVFLNHTGKGVLRDEYEADALACQWGFTVEVTAMRRLLGPPIDERYINI